MRIVMLSCFIIFIPASIFSIVIPLPRDFNDLSLAASPKVNKVASGYFHLL